MMRCAVGCVLQPDAVQRGKDQSVEHRSGRRHAADDPVAVPVVGGAARRQPVRAGKLPSHRQPAGRHLGADHRLHRAGKHAPFGQGRAIEGKKFGRGAHDAKAAGAVAKGNGHGLRHQTMRGPALGRLVGDVSGGIVDVVDRRQCQLQRRARRADDHVDRCRISRGALLQLVADEHHQHDQAGREGHQRQLQQMGQGPVADGGPDQAWRSHRLVMRPAPNAPRSAPWPGRRAWRPAGPHLPAASRRATGPARWRRCRHRGWPWARRPAPGRDG